ncbi:MAG: sulfite exporter TauE/SafE family protein [Phycisphaerales bacterium]
MIWLLLLIIALVAGVLSAVVGFGGSALMLPALHEVVGPRDAVVALTVAQIVGNASRVWFNRREIDRAALLWYIAGAVPMAIVGGAIFVTVPLRHLDWALGAALLVLVAGRRALAHRKARLSRKALLPVGAGTGLLSALAGFAGPLVAPFFLATGLVRGAYIGTEAAAALTVHAVKLPVYGVGGAVTPQAILAGAVLAPALIAGAWIGKRIVDRVSASLFTLLIEGALVVAAVRMIVQAA